jgi:hypothetical protein
VPPLFGYLGGLASALGLVLAVGLNLPRLVLRGVVVFACLGFVAIATVPAEQAIFIHGPEPNTERLSVNGIVVGTLGVFVFVTACIGAAIAGLGRTSRDEPNQRPSQAGRFIFCWFAIELAGYFAMSPFGAARRIMGLVVAATMVGGYLLSRRQREPGDQARIVWITWYGILLGIAYWAIDFADATVEMRAARESGEWIKEQPAANGTIWFTGQWGFRFYAEQQGMNPIHPGRSLLKAGDWLVVPDGRIRPFTQYVQIDPQLVELRWIGDWWLPLALRTIPDYYAGGTPLRKHEGPRVRVTVYRVRQDFLACTP